MRIFDFLAPDVDQAGMNQQTKLLKQAQGSLEEAQKRGRQDLKSGYKAAQPSFQQAADLWSGYGGENAQAMYLNSLGLNGQAGNDAALGAFQQGPGFQFALDQANQNILRNNAATGGVASGGTLAALQDRAQQMQNLEYGNWQDRLAGVGDKGYSGMANSLTNLGNFEYGFGRDKANLGTQYAPMMYNSYNDRASLLGQQMSQNMAADQAGIGNALGILGGLAGFFGA